ncbi:MAG: hypothetical protein AAFN50_00595 [Pseudomonadota bacterium]
MSLLGELSRRNVIRVSTAYVIAAWVVIQVADLVLENIEAPDWVIQTLMLLFALGFPVVIIFSWAYEVTPDGIKKESEIDRTASITHVTGRRLNHVITGLLVVALGYYVWESRSSRSDVSQAAQPAIAAEAEVGDLSIAVLPFENRSNREEDQFFVDGMHDDLLTTIAKIGSMKVISRTSVMEYKDTTKKIPEIAAELGVATVLEGGVQRAGNQVRINMQLIDAGTDDHLWAEIYDRELTAENLFEIQSEISSAIANALHATLTPEEQQRIDTAPTKNLDALDAYMRGRQHLATREGRRLELGLAEFERAVQLDPNFALAWVGVADSHHLLLVYAGSPPQESRSAAKAALDKALALDPTLGEAHASLGVYYNRTGDHARGEAELLKATELSPNYATSYHWLSNALLDNVLRLDDARAYGLRSLELDPRSAIIAANMALVYQTRGEYEEAEAFSRRMLDIHPNFPELMISLVNVSQARGEIAESLQHLEQIVEIDAGNLWSKFQQVANLLLLRESDAAQDLVRDLQNTAGESTTVALIEIMLATSQGDAARTTSLIEQRLAGRTFDYADAFAAYHAAMVDNNALAMNLIRRSFSDVDLEDPANWQQMTARNSTSTCLVSWLLIESGDVETGTELAQQAVQIIESEFPKYSKRPLEHGQEVCYMALGEHAKALDVIEGLAAANNYTTWESFQRLALFEPIRSTPRYLAVRQDFERWLAVERQKAGFSRPVGAPL